MEALVGKRIRPLAVLSTELTESESGLRLTERTLASHDGMQTWKHMLDSVRKYRRFVVRMTVVGAVLAGVAGLLMQPSYVATAQLAVDVRQLGPADSSGVAGAAAAPAAGTEESVIDTHVTVLLSDAYLRRLLPTLRALEDARNAARTGSGTWAQGFRTLLGNAWSETKKLILSGEPGRGEALAGLKRGLKVGQERRSRIISVAFTASDPQHAAEIANTVAKSYVDELVRQKQSDTEQVLNSLATQSSKIQRELAKAEEELRTYRVGQGATSQDSALERQVTTLAQQFETLLRRQEQTARERIVQPDVGLLATASPPERRCVILILPNEYNCACNSGFVAGLLNSA